MDLSSSFEGTVTNFDEKSQLRIMCAGITLTLSEGRQSQQ